MKIRAKKIEFIIAAILPQFMKGISTLIIVPLILAKFGLEDYGLIIISQMFAWSNGLLGQFDLGLPTLITNKAATNKITDSDNLLKLSCGYGIIISAAVILFLIMDLFITRTSIISTEKKDKLFWLIIITLIGNLFYIPYQLYNSKLMVGEKYLLPRFLDLLGSVLYIIFILVFTMISNNIICIVISQLIINLILFILVYFIAKSNNEEKKLIPDFRISNLMSYYDDMKPYMLSRISGISLRYFDVIYITLLMDPSILALYDLCLKIPTFLRTFFGKVHEIYAPKLIAIISQHPNIIVKDIIYDLIKIETLTGLFIIEVFFIFIESQKFINVDLIKSNIPNFLVPFVISLVVPLPSIVLPIVLGVGKHNTEMIKFPLINSILNVFSTVVFGSIFGLTGLLASTVFQYIFMYFSSLKYASGFLNYRDGLVWFLFVSIIYISNVFVILEFKMGIIKICLVIITGALLVNYIMRRSKQLIEVIHNVS